MFGGFYSEFYSTLFKVGHIEKLGHIRTLIYILKWARFGT